MNPDGARSDDEERRSVQPGSVEKPLQGRLWRPVWAVQLIAVSPTAHVRRPRLDYESHATGDDEGGTPLSVGALEGDGGGLPACLCQATADPVWTPVHRSGARCA
jgi:hypothetical protein